MVGDVDVQYCSEVLVLVIRHQVEDGHLGNTQEGGGVRK